MEWPPHSHVGITVRIFLSEILFVYVLGRIELGVNPEMYRNGGPPGGMGSAHLESP